MFISFEGIEGCGKTTQIKRIAKRIEKYGIPFVNTLEPGGTGIGKVIRRLLLDPGDNKVLPLAELILYEADRAQHVEEVIIPALRQGKWVICDRYTDATLAYQGMARGLDIEMIERLNREATRGVMPDATFLLDCPVEIGLDRAIKRNKKSSQDDQDRFERERLEFHQLVRKGYLELARKDEKRFIIVNGALGEDDVEFEIFSNLQPFLENQKA